MQNSYNSIALPSVEYDQLQNLMLTLVGSRTALASILRRKLGSAGRATSRVSPDVAISGRRVDFRIDGQQSEVRVLSWQPQKRGYPAHLSLLSPRGLALLGLNPGQSISYRTPEGRMEFLEVERVAEVDPPAKTRANETTQSSRASRVSVLGPPAGEASGAMHV